MKKICLQIPNKQKYVVACSFGPDSMALLDVAVKEKLDIVVAHVNYHHRKESNFEEEQLRKYCKKHNLKIEILDLLHIKPEGNFEGWARKVRYEFFAEVCKRNDANTVLVAHQQDDLLETYLMQKKRGNYVKNPGIAKKTTINGVKILRPFLKYTKVELLEFCDKNKIPYSIDSTNLTNEYERNKIRHEIVEKLSKEERRQLLKEIKQAKNTKIPAKNTWSAEKFSKLSYEEMVSVFEFYFNKYLEHRNISKSFYNEIVKFALSAKANCSLKITETIILEKAYRKIYLVNASKLHDFEFLLEKGSKLKNDFLNIDFHDLSGDRNVNKNDFPLTIRNSRKSDQYKIKNYSVKVSRLFLDWKMPNFVRKIWPIVLNKNNIIIYIPRYREKFTDFHKTKFEINIDYFLV